jgi:ATP-binding cassette subfamily B multidrug efflux pump
MSRVEHDDEILGKAYDARLMSRVWSVTRPHTRLVLLSLVVFPIVALLELVPPYLVKLAIDDISSGTTGPGSPGWPRCSCSCWWGCTPSGRRRPT